jgi:hypothetical protein
MLCVILGLAILITGGFANLYEDCDEMAILEHMEMLFKEGNYSFRFYNFIKPPFTF